jgi:hypothetical protein
VRKATPARWRDPSARDLLRARAVPVSQPDALPLELGKVVHEQAAIEMVHLMLQAHGQHALELELNLAPALVLARTRMRCARRTSSNMPGTDRQPSSPVASPSLKDFRIDEYPGLALVLGRR